MQKVKTSVSINKTLFREAEELARRMKVSRSHLFALALEEYIRRHRNREPQARINAADAREPDPAEQALHQRMRRTHRRIVKGEW